MKVPEDTLHFLIECPNYPTLNFKEILSTNLSPKLKHKEAITRTVMKIMSKLPRELQAKTIQGILSKDSTKTIVQEIKYELKLSSKVYENLKQTFHTSLIRTGKLITLQRWASRSKHMRENPMNPPPFPPTPA